MILGICNKHYLKEKVLNYEGHTLIEVPGTSRVNSEADRPSLSRYRTCTESTGTNSKTKLMHIVEDTAIIIIIILCLYYRSSTIQVRVIWSNRIQSILHVSGIARATLGNGI